jgi:hypothetical protein
MPDSLTESFLEHCKVSSKFSDGISTAGLVAKDRPTIGRVLEGGSWVMGFSAGLSEGNLGLTELCGASEFVGTLLSILAESFTGDVLEIAIVQTFRKQGRADDSWQRWRVNKVLILLMIWITKIMSEESREISDGW